jgi:Tol biopolymer transport system component
MGLSSSAVKAGAGRGAVVVLALSEKAEATFPGKNGRIVYAGWNRGEGLKGFEIYTINPDGSGKRQLTHNNTVDFSPAYSPDGKKIVYAGKDGPKGDLETYTINARGGDKFQVTNNDVDEEDPAYSPSGKRIAYTPTEGVGGIYSVKAGGGQETSRPRRRRSFLLARRQEDRLRVLRQAPQDRHRHLHHQRAKRAQAP